MASRLGISRTTLIWVVVLIVVVVVLGSLLAYYATRPTVSAVTSHEILFYTWWATTGKVALDHLIPAFEEAYPQYKVVPYLVPGAGGTNARYAIVALIEAGKPPTTFQTLLGATMIGYVEASPQGVNTFVNFTPYLENEGVLNHVVLPVFLAAAYNGTIISLPVNVHSGFVLYMNIKVLKEYNLPIPSNISQLLYDTVVLAQHGINPWCVGGADGGYDQEQLWFAIFLALGGPKLMDEVLYGTLNLSDPYVQQIFNETNEIFLNITSYNQPGWESMTWTQCISLLAEGKSVFQVDVDSGTNYLYDYLNVTTYPAIEPYISWNNVTVVAEMFPGDQNYFVLVADAIAVPHGPNEKAGILFALYWASYAGQEVWTRWKASTYYLNGTDWYNTPEQWWMYQRELQIPNQNWVIDPLSLFPDVDSEIYQGLLTLQEIGKPALSNWYSTFTSAMAEERAEWLKAAQLGLGYLGFPGQPFGGYTPPWVDGSSG